MKTDEEVLHRIFSLLRSNSGHDFSLYKNNTICRRIERRIFALHMDSMSTYVDYLEKNERETQVLLNDLLIGVTNFFRGSKAYAALKEVLLSDIEAISENETFRVWIPACSTGEEAYSMAILLQECINTLNRDIDFQIFASDIDEQAIKTARSGIYPNESLYHVSDDRLHRFFTKMDKQYRINRDIREHIIFATQSVIKDPPFTRIHLISCRNLMIYLGTVLQKKLLPLFHYSLNLSGLLFLGASESIGGFSDHFSCLDKKNKLYRRKLLKVLDRTKIKFPISRPLSNKNFYVNKERRNAMNTSDVQTSFDDLLLEHGIAPCILTDKQGEILYIHGSVSDYVGPSAGIATLNVVDMSRPGLETKLSYAIREINHDNTPLVYHNVGVGNDTLYRFHLIVKLITDASAERELILVQFERAHNSPAATEHTVESQDGHRVVELERELKYTKENLQSTIEELKSTNEELQSTNEELQSTNEELETSKEELVTVNAELENRIEELSNTNDDIKNLLDSTNIATIFLDNDFQIKRYTPKAREIIRLIPSDVGRSIFDIVHNLQNDEFIDLIKSTILSGKLLEQEVSSIHDHSFYMRITPYNTMHGNQEGVVLTFEDITEIKRHRDHLESLVEIRTEEIKNAEAELRRYEKKHAGIDRMNSVSEIAVSIAHEINQPLANLSNYAQGLLERVKNNDVNKEMLEATLDKLIIAARRSSNIVNSMRDFLLKKPPNFSNEDLNSIVRNVAEHLKPTCQKHKIQIKFYLDDTLPRINLDAVQLEQVFINLLNNAIEAVAALSGSHRKIRLRTDYDDAFVHISVEDNGPEISLETIKKMFDLFFTTKSEGLGIGLAVCRTIIESHGGSICYISDAERHNIFKITLPLGAL